MLKPRGLQKQQWAGGEFRPLEFRGGVPTAGTREVQAGKGEMGREGMRNTRGRKEGDEENEIRTSL